MRVFRFGQFRLEEESQQLFRKDLPIQLTGKRFELLHLLVESAGQVVKKEEIFARVWPDQILEESNLTQNIYMLRRVLDDNPKNPQFILTVPGAGYIFYEPVEVEEVALPGPSSNAVSAGAGHDLIAGDDLAPSVHAPPTGRRSRYTRRTLIFSAALLALLIVGLAISRQWPTPVPPTQVKIVPLATLPGMEMYPAFSPDGRFIAFASEGETLDNQDIYLRVVNQGQIIRVTSNHHADKQPVWSPDGREIAFLRTQERFGDKLSLMIAASLGGAEREVTRVWGGLDWSPDGRFLAVADSTGAGAPTLIYLVSTDGAERRQVTWPVGEGSVYDTLPRFSPDGKSILFLRWRSGVASDLFLIDLESRRERQLTFDNRSVTGHDWSADGREILFVSNRDGNPRLWRLTLTDQPPQPRLVEGLTDQPDQITVSRNGGMLAYTQKLNNSTVEISRLLPTSAGLKSASCQLDSSRPDHSPRFSPDGQRLVFVSNRSGSDELWLANRDCTAVTQLTRFNEQLIGSPRWSPDGQQIAFDRHVDNQSEVFVISALGGNLRRMTNHPAADSMPGWSPDGRWIYFSTFRSGSREIWKLPVEGGEPVPVTRQEGKDPVVDRDGRVLYFTVREQLWRRDLESGVEGPLPALAGQVVGRAWDLQANGLYFVQSSPDSNPVVLRFDSRSARIDPVAKLDGPLSHWVPGISVSIDEDLLAASYLRYRLGDIMLVTGW